jgi:predicted unusual protein kinase regulating ubiquinone biosynthesis (AarF/ABC1/UbiB family)
MSETVVEEISNYRILKSKPLGQGACGQVYYGQSKAGIKVAVKSIDINKLTDHIEKQIKS